ncbi:hypothetical protein PC9H_003404 [Pleurotus ostreatus]|uniref:Structure-specific endonuclease subunit SLX4 n=1 Tax=Pleurotus ostreatus TaxID=5322 RepID=A0A8H7A2B0_PLEOS|nr:uncharacterized protein PC9H_003404 [Pleurotus ostreatus]KAF7436571.1 hypothetical protein PC9H_003404 [Pleurotus ostreatus]
MGYDMSLDWSFENEVIDDSEPEREEMRRLARRTLSRSPGKPDKGKARMVTVGDVSDVEIELGGDRVLSEEVIEISSSDEDRLPALRTETVMVESSNFPGLHSATMKIGAPASSYFRRPASPVANEPEPVNVEIDQGGRSQRPEIQDEDEDEEPKPSLARFAYAPSTASNGIYVPKRSLSSRAASTISDVPAPTITASKTTKKRTKAPSMKSQLVTQFTDSQLSLILVCVCCELKWTTRKSSPQKLAHIKSCAKKKSYTDETVCSLMAAALSKIPPKEPDPPKIDESEKPAPTKTYLEGVLHDATKKKGRRVKVTETVRSVTETRSDILCKAQAVLGRNSKQRVDDGLEVDDSTKAPRAGPSKQPLMRKDTEPQTLSDDELGETDAMNVFPATQAFAASKFATATRTTTLFHLADQDDSESDGDMSEPEPQFAPSKLAIRRRSPTRTSGSPSINKRKTATFDELEGLMKPTTRSEIISRLDQAIFQANLNGYALPRSEMKVPDLHSARTIATDNTLEFGDLIATEDIRHEDSLHDYALTTDDAYLHYDPGVSAALTPIHSPWRRQNGQSKSNRSPPHKLPASPRTPPKSPRKRAPKAASETPRRKGKARAEEEFGDAWRQQLNDAIVNNSALHLRILRYEPVHFDEFVNLMIDKPTTNSRAALRLFLDERAISFYGATVRKRR